MRAGNNCTYKPHVILKITLLKTPCIHARFNVTSPGQPCSLWSRSYSQPCGLWSHARTHTRPCGHAHTHNPAVCGHARTHFDRQNKAGHVHGVGSLTNDHRGVQETLQVEVLGFRSGLGSAGVGCNDPPS
jgi:hypothetical protein